MTKNEYNSNRPRVECPVCGKLFTKPCFNRHYRACSDPSSKLNVNDKNVYKVTHEGLDCCFCGKTMKNTNALTQHELRCNKNPNRKDFCKEGFNTNGNSSIRRGDTKETNPILARCSETLKEGYASGRIVSWAKGKPGTFKGKHHREESKTQIGKHVSISRKEGYASGHIVPAEGVGRGKYSYIVTSTHKYMLRSTYEFIFAVYLLHVAKVEFEMEAIKVPALRQNKYASTFLSDFSIGDTVIEIKGIASGKDYYIKESFEAAGYRFIELFHESIEKIKQQLVDTGINIEELLRQVVDGHNSKNYFTYDISNLI